MPARQQTYEAENTPEDGDGCRDIANQRFMRPIVCVSRIGSWTIRAASPRGPPKERGQLLLLCTVGQCAVRDRVL